MRGVGVKADAHCDEVLRDNMAMSKKQPLELSTFDGQLLDGLDFCRKVYDLFDQVQAGPDGIAKLRLRPTKSEKRLIEELIPIARYVQARYREGRRIQVRWFGGSKPYDAVLRSSGGLVEHRMAPRKLFVEVTTAVHQNEYLARHLLHEKGGSFGVKGISRDQKTGNIISKPTMHTPERTCPGPSRSDHRTAEGQELQRLFASNISDYQLRSEQPHFGF
jgi:hypothetical protein